MKKISTIFIIIFSIVSSTSFAQIELDIITSKKMMKDLDVLLETIDAHPDPYTKISEADFNVIVDEVRNNISKDLDQIDFYKNLSKIIASIKDGHSGLYMPVNWLTTKRKKHGALPYEVFLKDDEKLFVVDTYGETAIPKGAQIIEIGGISTQEFIKIITPYISYETLPFRNDQISSNFEFLLYIAFKKVDGLSIKYTMGAEESITISTTDYKTWKSLKKDQREENEKSIAMGKPYKFEIIKPGIAKLDIFSFSVPDSDKFALFLSKTFRTIKKENVHSLIIDVRGNYGGWPKIASEIFHYIHDGFFKTMAQSSTKISKPYRDYYYNIDPRLRTTNFIFPQRRHFVNIEKVVNGRLDTYDNEDAFFNESPITQPHEFTGDTYVLIDRKSYSAASSFASTFQCYNMGYLIGEATGGTKIFRANPFTKKLPKSYFNLRMSTTILYTACYNEEDQPITPNIEVIPSVVEKVHKIDSQLKMALLVIKKIQRKKQESK